MPTKQIRKALDNIAQKMQKVTESSKEFPHHLTPEQVEKLKKAGLAGARLGGKLRRTIDTLFDPNTQKTLAWAYMLGASQVYRADRQQFFNSDDILLLLKEIYGWNEELAEPVVEGIGSVCLHKSDYPKLLERLAIKKVEEPSNDPLG